MRCCCDSEGTNLGRFSLLLNLSPSPLNTSITCDRGEKKCVFTQLCADMSSVPSQQAGQKTVERDRGTVSLWSRLPLRHGRKRLHSANPYPRQQSWPSHRQKRRDHQTTAGLRCTVSSHIFNIFFSHCQQCRRPAK